VREICCPVCANEIEWSSLRFECLSGPSISTKLGNQIKNAVFAVDQYHGEIRKPEIAPYLWCPNCTAPLEEHDDPERRLECKNCSLKLRITTHADLVDLRDEHLRLDETGELFLNNG
jgi:hypothetical protein